MAVTDQLFERSPVGMALHDSALRFTRVNDACAEMLGCDPDAMLGRRPSELFGAPGEETEMHMRSVIETGRPIVGMELAAEVDGGERRYIFTCFPVGDGVGVVLGDVTERRRTESWLTRQHARNALLATAARELDLAEGVEALAQRVAELAVPSLGEWAVLELAREDGTLERLGVAASDSVRPPESPDGEGVLAMPLRARGRVIGRLSLGIGSEDRAGEDERMTARLLAEHAALALDGAMLAERQRRVASQLQAGLLPPVLPTVPDLELAARYRAAGAGADVGGDFYDAFSADGEWVLVIGDVAGKGPAAAAITGLARHTLRAAARYEHDPADALLALNDAMLQQLGGQRHCTAAIVRVRSDAAGMRAHVRCAGHLPALVLRAGGTVETLGQPGHPLGILDAPTFHDEGAPLRSGDTLVLYTDGVTEAGGGDGGLGEEGLAEVVRGCAGLSPSAVLFRIESAVSERGSVRDDIALLAARVR